MPVSVAILGPTGYSGLEIIRILLRHPEARVAYLGGRREERPHIADIWPSLRSLLDLRVESMEPEEIPPGVDVVFLALPHGVSLQYVPHLLGRGFKVVDLGADYRLKDAAAYKKWYGLEHTDPANLTRAVYGLTEFYRDQIARADLVANPGCYPTSIALAVAPLTKTGLADKATIVADSKSGISGAGRQPSEETHFPECNESVAAYKVGTHRHAPEIEQTLTEISGDPWRVCFVPHLIPMDRGILSTCYVRLKQPLPTEHLQRLFAQFYAREPFVRVRTDGTLPKTKDVWGTNFCDVAVRAVGDLAVVVSVIDNLVKGAAGQAVENMNVMFGLDEKAGLL